MATDTTTGNGITEKSIFPVLLFNLVIYLCIGFPMAVIPIYVHNVLHYSAVMAGLAISIQYIATFATRPSAGKISDTTGPKTSVSYGLLIGCITGILVILSTTGIGSATLSLLILLLSRLALGWAESWTTTSVIVWNIHRAGANNTSRVISWNGITSYGGIALGATIGELLSGALGAQYGLMVVGGIILAMSAICWFICRTYTAVKPTPTEGPSLSFLKVMRMVMPHGSVLVCGSIGFSSIWSYMALYFSYEHWGGAAIGLFLFGVAFIFVRLIFGKQVPKRGGAIVTMISMAVEALGLLIICLIPNPIAADIGAFLTGAGFSLVFPGLGTLAVEHVGQEHKGTAVGCFALYFDIAVAISAPLLGFIIGHAGFRPLYLIATVIPIIGIVIVKKALMSNNGPAHHV